jgi:hypothetical protein
MTLRLTALIVISYCVIKSHGFSLNKKSIPSKGLPPTLNENNVEHHSNLIATKGNDCNEEENINHRREFLHQIFASTLSSSGILLLGLTTTSDQVHAMEKENITIAPPTATANTTATNLRSKPSPKKPSAPLSALLPAARVKSTIDDAVVTTNEILSLTNNNDATNEKLLHLQEIILIREENGFMSSLDAGDSTNNNNNNKRQSLNFPSSNSKLNEDAYKEKLKMLPVQDKPLALLSKVGDNRQFDILQRRQRRLEKNSPIREAMNFYTRQIQFNTESYILNASAEDRKRMIRDDSLPDIKSVIVSDLDLRDLVRNQILDAYDDVRAELQYQLRNWEQSRSSSSGELGETAEFDLIELKLLLLRAQKECDRWFDFIDEYDVKQAMNVVSTEINANTNANDKNNNPL